jgi:hypothetical protein
VSRELGDEELTEVWITLYIYATMCSKYWKAKDTPFHQLQAPPVRGPIHMCLPDDLCAGGRGPETGIVYGQTTRTPTMAVWRDWYAEYTGERHCMY